ncbi:class F sortase [Actinomycetospora sp. OC33-EN08]|uniref:Class F sortase n=1 Tax=Actinomycetospora aurantiaca TaxID=3129233 RepID=A0ABU8MNW2_9PSEU
MKGASTATALAVVSTLGIGVALCSQAPPPTVLAAGPHLVVAGEDHSGSDDGSGDSGGLSGLVRGLTGPSSDSDDSSESQDSSSEDSSSEDSEKSDDSPSSASSRDSSSSSSDSPARSSGKVLRELTVTPPVERSSRSSSSLLDTPTVELPAVSVPSVPLGPVGTPPVTVGSASLPSVRVAPQQPAPVDVGTLRLPAVSAGSTQLGPVSTPSLDVGATTLAAPGGAPEVGLPSVGVGPTQVGPVSAPSVALDPTTLSTAGAAPAVGLPSVSVGSSTVGPVSVPPVALAAPTLPLRPVSPLTAAVTAPPRALVALAVTSAPSLLPTQLTAPPSGDQGVLRVAHLSPSTGAVDMYVSGPDLPSTKVASDVTYRTLSNYLTASPGIYTLAARPAGADPASPPALSANVEVGVRSAQTAAFVDIGPNSTPQAEVLDDGTQLANPGRAYVRVVSAASGVGPLNVTAEGGGTLASGVFYGTSSPYAEVDARSWTMDVTTTSGETARTTLPVTSTSVNTVVVARDPQGALTVTAVPDAAPLFAPAAAQSPAPAVPAAPQSPAPAAPQSPAPAAPAPAAPAAPAQPSAPSSTPTPSTTTPAPAPTPKPAPAPSTRPTPQGGVPAGFGGMSGAVVDLPARPAAPTEPELPTWGAPTSPVRPAGLLVPDAKIDAPAVGNLGLDRDGELQAPATPHDVGWFGSTPGDAGPAVLVGHVDSWRGPGVFWNLKDLEAGDPIDVPRSDGTVARFAVDRVQTVDKDTFPTEAVYGATAGPSLRLITCGGAFDRSARSYEDNVIVYASPR